LDKLAENVSIIRKNTHKKIMAVVKSNAYGLGIEAISEFLDDKVDAFAVNNPEEAFRVKSNKPVLILIPPTAREEVEQARNNFIYTVDSEKSLELIKDFSRKVHVLVNTGMNRFGVSPSKADTLIERIRFDYPHVEIDGIYTHLHNTRNKKYTRHQISLFRHLVEKYRAVVNNIHILNSRGFLDYNDTDFDNCLRVGNLLYGYDGYAAGFRKIFSFKARLIHTDFIEKNGFAGYRRSRVNKRTRIGILEMGAFHGFNCRAYRRRGLLYEIARAAYRHLKNDSNIYYKGKMVKILGNSMSCTTISLDGLDLPSDFNGIDEAPVFDVVMSSVIADSSIEKVYKQGV